MKHLFTLFLCILSLTSSWADGVGTWRYYPAYNGISEVDSISSSCIFVLSSGNIYKVNKEEWTVQTYDRITGLTDVDIKTMAWNGVAKRMVLIYSNSNIDLMTKEGDVTNIPDIYNKETTLDKTINSIFIKDQFAYLSTGFGIIKLDARKAEISDSYNLGENISKTYLDKTNIYAMRSDGSVLTASLSSNLLDKRVWSEYTGSTAGMFDAETVSESLKKSIASLYPTGPRYPIMGFMRYRNGKLYTSENSNWDNGMPDCPQIYDIANDTWTILDNDDNAISSKTNMLFCDFFNIEVDPFNENHIMAAAHGGIYEFLDGKFVKLLTDTNTPMTSAIKDMSFYVLPSAMKYTNDGTLWIALSQGTNNVSFLSLDRNNKWSDHSSSKWIYNNLSLAHVTSIITDSRGIIWWTNNHWWKPALCGYDPATDTHYCYSTFLNEDNNNVSVLFVRCVTEDKDGNLWIGTNVGPLMLEKKNVKSGEEVQWQQVKVPRNDGTNYADYLLAGVDINCIMVDGANRKWFGTNGNGIYVIDSDNITQVANYTSTSSLLPSNVVKSMEANNATGEVYIGTEKGLCSYRSDATEPVDEMNEDDVYAYPNPVTPDYNGPITVVGLSFNADVKITTTSGHLVAQGRSNGGSFTWYGKDMSGKPVASGVYMVCVADEEGNKGVVTKIAIVR